MKLIRMFSIALLAVVSTMACTDALDSDDDDMDPNGDPPGCTTSCGSWSVSTSMQTARDRAGVAVVDGKIYVIGGAIVDNSALVVGEVYDPTTGNWTTIADMISPQLAKRMSRSFVLTIPLSSKSAGPEVPH